MSAPDLSAAALSTWEANATFWDQAIGAEGNKYWKVLQVPCLKRLLGHKLANHGGVCAALDLATGNGLGARWLASNGATSVLATDGSEKMLELAEAHIAGDERIELRRLDATSEEDFDRLIEATTSTGNPGFDIILINMAIMDVATLEPLAKALPKLLAKDGVFVATILHPVFFTAGVSKNVEERYNETGDLVTIRSKVVREYLHVPPSKGIAIPGQPVKQLYFHRPMHELFMSFLAGGELVLDAIEEPAFTEADRDPERVESTCNFTQIPALLAFRLRRRV